MLESLLLIDARLAGSEKVAGRLLLWRQGLPSRRLSPKAERHLHCCVEERKKGCELSVAQLASCIVGTVEVCELAFAAHLHHQPTDAQALERLPELWAIGTGHLHHERTGIASAKNGRQPQDDFKRQWAHTLLGLFDGLAIAQVHGLREVIQRDSQRLPPRTEFSSRFAERLLLVRPLCPNLGS